MERLTIPDVLVDEHTTRRTMIDVEAVREHAMDFYWRLKAYEDTHMMPSDVTSMRMDMAIIAALFNGIDVDRMKELAEADRAGRLEVLPCKVGDTVWAIDNPWTGKLLKKPIEAYANGMKKFSHGLYVDVLFDTRKINGTRDYEINHIGKTVFLTREGAEAALEAMKDE